MTLYFSLAMNLGVDMPRSFFKYILLCFSIYYTPLVFSLQISDASLIMPPSLRNSIVTLTNNFDRAAFVMVNVDEISSPTAQGITKKTNSSDVRLSVKRFLIPAYGKKSINVNYTGERGKQEKYFRVSWKEEFLQYATKTASLIKPIKTETLLIINPDNVNFNYFYSKGTLVNNGNASFRAIAQGQCADDATQENCSQQVYLMPGAKSRFDAINLASADSHVTIHYNDEYIKAN